MSSKFLYFLRFFFAVTVVAGPLVFHSQEDVDVNKLLLMFPNQQVVYLEKAENVEIRTVKGELSIVKHNKEKILLLKNGLNNIRNRKIRTSEFIKVKNISAHLHVYNGKKHSRKAIHSIELKMEQRGDDGIFYDNDQFYVVNFFEGKEGDIVEINYDEEFAEPRFFGSFYFSDYYPTIKGSYSLTFQNDIVIKSKEFNNQKLNLKYTNEKEKRKTVLNWQLDSIKPLIDEDYDPSYRNKASYILFSVEKFRRNDSDIKVCGSLENLYSWYNHLLKNVDLTADEYLVKLSDSLTSGIKDEKEKVKQIYYFVQDKIAYLAYEDGLGGYIPREANVVCKRRFGDCKDMANLITRLAQIAKLPVYRTWIGTRDIPYQFSEFPAPFCANHMIATYVGKTDTVFLDATGKYYPFGLPTSMIQGKEALIGIDKDNFILKKVPVMDRRYNVEHDSIVLNILNSNKIQGKGFYKLYGYEKISLLHLFGNRSYQWQKEYLKDVLEKGNNKFSLDTFFVIQQDIEKPLVLQYQFTINDYLTENNTTKFVNLNFLNNYFDKFSTVKRSNPFSFSFASTNKLSVNLNVSDYKVDYVPTDMVFRNSVCGFDLKYKKNPGSIYFENVIDINKPDISQSSFTELNTAVNNYKKSKSNLVSITLIK